MKLRYVAALIFALPLFGQVSYLQAHSGPAPAWLRYLGDGRDGALMLSSNSNLAGDFYFTSFTVPAGVTLSTSGLTIHSLGPCRIDGILRAVGNDYAYGGGSGGGGGGGASPGLPGQIGGQFPWSNSNAWGGFGGAASGGSGAAGPDGFNSNASVDLTQLASLAVLPFRYYIASGWGLDGAGLGGSRGGTGGSSGGFGGPGGANVILICASIAGSGLIDASGGAGCTLQASNPAAGCSTGANNEGAGGGGGGGAVIFSSQQPITFTGTLNVAGGAGGTCGTFTGCGPGGAGGNGWIYAVSGWQP